MIIAESFEELRAARASFTDSFGLVPTMGYLHQGHLSLVQRARTECAQVGVSIFVNPTQFGPREDLSSYPRDLESDFALLAAEGVDLVWTPTEAQMYPPGYQTWVEVEHLTAPLEGAQRSGHFRGVTTVVAKLFNAMQPQKAYFGQKDAQQAIVIRRMVQDLSYPIEIVVCPVVREPDGLAMSSRNSYLSPSERAAATVLHRALSAAVDVYESGEHDAAMLRGVMEEILNDEPLAHTQYVSLADPQTLQECSGEVSSALLSMAVYVGKTRLIDNMLIGEIA